MQFSAECSSPRHPNGWRGLFKFGACLSAGDLLGQVAVQHDSDLSAGALAGRVKGRGALAGDDAVLDGPFHCGGRVGADLVLIGVTLQRSVDSGAACVAVQDGCDLLAGDSAVGVEGRVGRAGDDVVLVGPQNCVVVVGACLDIREGVGDVLHRGLVSNTVEDGDQHGAGHGLVRAEGLGCGAGDQLICRHEIDGVCRPLAGVGLGDVAEVVGLRLLDHGEGERAGVDLGLVVVDGVGDLRGRCACLGNEVDIRKIQLISAGVEEEDRLGGDFLGACDGLVVVVQLAAGDGAEFDVEAFDLTLGVVVGDHGLVEVALEAGTDGVDRGGLAVVDGDGDIAVDIDSLGAVILGAVGRERNGDGVLAGAGACRKDDGVEVILTAGGVVDIVAVLSDVVGVAVAALVEVAVGSGVQVIVVLDVKVDVAQSASLEHGGKELLEVGLVKLDGLVAAGLVDDIASAAADDDSTRGNNAAEGVISNIGHGRLFCIGGRNKVDAVERVVVLAGIVEALVTRGDLGLAGDAFVQRAVGRCGEHDIVKLGVGGRGLDCIHESRGRERCAAADRRNGDLLRAAGLDIKSDFAEILRALDHDLDGHLRAGVRGFDTEGVQNRATVGGIGREGCELVLVAAGGKAPRQLVVAERGLKAVGFFVELLNRCGDGGLGADRDGLIGVAVRGKSHAVCAADLNLDGVGHALGLRIRFRVLYGELTGVILDADGVRRNDEVGACAVGDIDEGAVDGVADLPLILQVGGQIRGAVACGSSRGDGQGLAGGALLDEHLTGERGDLNGRALDDRDRQGGHHFGVGHRTGRQHHDPGADGLRYTDLGVVKRLEIPRNVAHIAALVAEDGGDLRRQLGGKLLGGDTLDYGQRIRCNGVAGRGFRGNCDVASGGNALARSDCNRCGAFLECGHNAGREINGCYGCIAGGPLERRNFVCFIFLRDLRGQREHGSFKNRLGGGVFDGNACHSRKHSRNHRADHRDHEERGNESAHFLVHK